MLEGLAQKKDLIFVRDGDEHTCDEAVSHLRLKLGNTRNRIDTAEQFIDKVASSSSITGKPYIVKMPGKRIVKRSCAISSALSCVPLLSVNCASCSR